jgi:hypothetical protein
MSAWPLLVCQERKTPIRQLSLLAARPAVLALHTQAFLSLLDEAPLINRQDRILLSPKALTTSASCSSRRTSASRVAQPLQMLETIRCLEADNFRQLPDVLAFCRAQKAAQMDGGAFSRGGIGEMALQPPGRLLQGRAKRLLFLLELIRSHGSYQITEWLMVQL